MNIESKLVLEGNSLFLSINTNGVINDILKNKSTHAPEQVQFPPV